MDRLIKPFFKTFFHWKIEQGTNQITYIYICCELPIQLKNIGKSYVIFS